MNRRVFEDIPPRKWQRDEAKFVKENTHAKPKNMSKI